MPQAVSQKMPSGGRCCTHVEAKRSVQRRRKWGQQSIKIRSEGKRQKRASLSLCVCVCVCVLVARTKHEDEAHNSAQIVSPRCEYECGPCRNTSRHSLSQPITAHQRPTTAYHAAAIARGCAGRWWPRFDSHAFGT